PRIAKSSQLPISPAASAGCGSIFHAEASAALRLAARHNNASASNLAVAATNVLKEWRCLSLRSRRTDRQAILSPPVSESPPVFHLPPAFRPLWAFRLQHSMGLIRLR